MFYFQLYEHKHRTRKGIHFIHFEVSFTLHIKRYEFQVNIWCDLHISSPVKLTVVKHVLVYVEVTTDIY